VELLSPLLTGIVTKLAPVPGSNIQTDGAIVLRGPSGLAVALVLVQEVKRDIGKASSEPSLQGAGYQARFWLCRLDSAVMQFTCCPAFLVSSRSNAQRGALACLSPSSGWPKGGGGGHMGRLGRHGQSLTASLPTVGMQVEFVGPHMRISALFFHDVVTMVRINSRSGRLLRRHAPANLPSRSLH
jgi:hypothetical protein